MPGLDKLETKDAVIYVGIAADEPNRFHVLSDKKRSPLVEAGWYESNCGEWCKTIDLLSPTYTTSNRGGCWFCHNQSVNQLRLLRRNYPDLWAIMLKWDKDSPVTFKPPKRQWVADLNGPETRLVYSGENDDVVEREERGYWKNLPGCTVHDFDRRFELEDAGLVYPDERFKWSMLDEELNYRWF